jgi:hypothetical protein
MTFRDPTLLERLGCGQQGVGASPHARTSSGEVHPAHHSRGIYQELCRPGDILSVRSSTRMQQMIAPYQLGVGIGENGKSVTSLPTEITRDLWSVHTDRDGPYTRRFELRKPILNASQLEVAERSPVAVLKNQQLRFWRRIIER